MNINMLNLEIALKLMGLDSGRLRLPLCEISDSNLAILKKAMLNSGVPLAE